MALKEYSDTGKESSFIPEPETQGPVSWTGDQLKVPPLTPGPQT